MESTLFYLRVSFISCFIGGDHFVILHNFSGKMEPPIDQFPLDHFFLTGRIAGDHTGNLLLQFGSLNNRNTGASASQHDGRGGNTEQS